MIPSHKIRRFLQLQFKAHPWHGIPPQPQPHGHVGAHIHPHIQPGGGALVGDLYNAFIELTPTDGVKYEVDKDSGHIKVDRPQKFSNLCPTLYGFIPRTHCGRKIGDFCSQQLGRPGIVGDGDPLDICVLTEKPIAHNGIVVHARPIGGLRMVDSEQADDKIVAVLENDVTYGHLKSIQELPLGLLDRLRQYFLTYKMQPPRLEKVDGASLSAGFSLPSTVEIPQVYDRDEAIHVIRYSLEDYKEKFGSVHEDLAQFLFELAHTVADHAHAAPPGEVR